MSDTYLYLDASATKAEIAKLLADYPELTDDETLRADLIEGETNAHKIIERALSEKLDADAMATAIKERVTDLTERRGRFERKAEAMKALIKSIMQSADLDKLQLTEATLSIAKPRTSVNVTDLEALPQGYFRLKREADKAAIKSALEQGGSIPGAELTLGSPSLTVRTK